MVGPSDIASVALTAGLSRREANLEIQDRDVRNSRNGTQVRHALSKFFELICAHPPLKRALEYVRLPNFLSLPFLEKSEVDLQFIVPDSHVSGVLRELIKGTSAQVSSETPNDESGKYDLIICQPAFGSKTGASDGYGGEVVQRLSHFLSEQGLLFWIAGQGALHSGAVAKTIAEIAQRGTNLLAAIDLPPGIFPGAKLAGALFVLKHSAVSKKLVGVIRDEDGAAALARVLLSPPTAKGASVFAWLERDNPRTFGELEEEAILRRLIPRGRQTQASLASILVTPTVKKLREQDAQQGQPPNCLFVPEYAGSKVTSDIEQQTVKVNALYRLEVDPTKANARFLALLLNSAYGKQLRSTIVSGLTIPRLIPDKLLKLLLPLPIRETQEEIARIDADLGLLRAQFDEINDAVDRDWSQLADARDKVEGLKSVLNLEQKIDRWWTELPYPLAAIYRRYRVSTDAKDRLDILLHFFEMAAVYLATLGASHIRILREDWQAQFSKWLHPAGSIGIERADFGFWVSLARVSIKDLSRIFSDKELRKFAKENGGSELLQTAERIGALGKATEILDKARHLRNTHKGHGGHIKTADAERIEKDLQSLARDLFQVTSAIFKSLLVVRPGRAELTEDGLRVELEKMVGSDPTFDKEIVELDRRVRAKTNALCFWMRGTRTMCPALPFFRLGAPQQPRETSCYVFNRVENGSFRWISYQEAREQEVLGEDEELSSIIEMGKAAATS
jgi:hypothetical protein